MADLPEYKSSEKLQPSSGPVGFVKAAEKQAAAGNFLTNIGSEIALNAGIARTQQAGIEFGKNPHGDLLPALNKTDEAFQNAYRNTAKATLTLQGEELLSKGLTTLNQATKLTPALIDNFSAQMQKGIDEIASNAPQMDRVAINQNLKLGLITAQGQLQGKLAKQHQDELKANFAAYAQSTNSTIYDVSSSGDQKGSTQLLDSLISSITIQVESGLLDKNEGLSLINAAKITNFTGGEFFKAKTAEKNGQLDVFLSKWRKSDPKDLGMTPSEYVKVGQGLLALLNLQDSLEAKNQATLTAEVDLHIAKDDINQGLLSKAKEQQTPENLFKTLTKIQIHNNQKDKAQKKTKDVMINWSNSSNFALNDPSDINKAYDALWQDLAQKEGLTDWEAKTQIAATAGGKVTDYTKEFNALGSSPNAQSLQMASDAYKYISKIRAANLEGVETKVLGMINSFDRQRTANTDPAIAAKNAEKQVYLKDESKVKILETEWTTIKKNVFGTSDKKLENGAASISGMRSTTDPVGFALRVQEVYEQTFKEVGNDLDAITAVKDYFNAAYGTTYVNGRKEEGQFGTIEQALNISETELPIVQVQIAEQAAKKLVSYNEGNFAYKYKFKSPISITLEERERAKEEYKEIQKTMLFNNPDVVKRYRELQGMLKSSVNITPHEVETISKELAEITSRATLEEVIKSHRFENLSEAEQIRLIEESYGNKSRPKKETIDRIIELQGLIKNVEDQSRPVLQQIDSDGRVKDYYLGIYRAPDGEKSKGQPVYYMRLINMDGRIENFTGVMQYNGGEVIYVPDIEDFEQKYGRYIHTADSGGQGALSKMRRQMQERALEAEQAISKKQKKEFIIKEQKEKSMPKKVIVEEINDSGDA